MVRKVVSEVMCVTDKSSKKGNQVEPEWNHMFHCMLFMFSVPHVYLCVSVCHANSETL